MRAVRDWIASLFARLFRRPTVQPLVQCLHPNPPGFNPCNRYGYASCKTCKAKVPC